MSDLIIVVLALLRRYQSLPLPTYGLVEISIKLHQGRPQSPQFAFRDLTEVTEAERAEVVRR